MSKPIHRSELRSAARRVPPGSFESDVTHRSGFRDMARRVPPASFANADIDRDSAKVVSDIPDPNGSIQGRVPIEVSS